jgi:non-heme chloroperoxidase
MQRRDVLLTAMATGMMASAASAASVSPERSGTRRETKVRTSDGVELFCRDWGTGPAVVFTHSWALTSAIWNYQVQFLSNHGIRCVTYDRRGHGRSDAPTEGYDLDTLADDLGAVIDSLEQRKVVLVGHSMGGNEIIRYVGRHGTGKVAKIALLAPTTPYVRQTPDNPYGAPAAYFEHTRAQWETDFPKWVQDNKAAFFTPETSPPMMDWIVTLMLQMHIPTAIACSRAVGETDLRPDLVKINRPVLILHGDRDVSAPLEITGRRTVAGIQGATLKVYPGAPHGLFLTHMAQVNQDLLEFVTI